MSVKPIHFIPHAHKSLNKRGATEDEVIEAIETATWYPAEGDRFECDKEFPFNALWNGKFYQWKKVRPIFVERDDRIVVITVFTFYY